MTDNKKFSGMMIASDIDGTIKPSKKPVCERNMKAIRYFEENGGIFTLATGRSIAATRLAVDEMGLKCPVIVNNGATAYDYEKEEILFTVDLDESAYDITRQVMERFPNCGIEVYNGRELYILRRTEMTDERLEKYKVNKNVYSFCTLEQSVKPWQKMLAVAEESEADKVMEFFNSIGTDKILFMKTSPNYCEMVPYNATKADGVKNLARLLNVREDRIFTAGDHNNDIQLLKAGYKSFAPSDGIEIAKQTADFITCSCEDGVIADVVEYIEKNII